MSQILDLRGTTKAIESTRIQKSSRDSYTSMLVLLLIHLFDSEQKDVAFAVDILEIFNAANEKDKLEKIKVVTTCERQ